MNCVHTGCEILIEHLGLTVRADTYYIRDAWIIRWIPTAATYSRNGIYDYTTIAPFASSEVWCREDLGVMVLPTEYLVVHSDTAREKIKCFRTIVGVNLSVNKYGEATKS